MNNFPIEFSILNQIFFYKRNRIYQLIIKDSQLFGIFLQKRLYDLSKTTIVIDILTFILTFIIGFLVFPSLRNLGDFWYILILFVLWVVLLKLFIKIPYFANKIRKEESNKLEKCLAIIKESKNLIENLKIEEFLSKNKNNFVFTIDKIEKSKTKYDEFLDMLPERYGRLYLTLKDGSKKDMILAEYNYEDFKILFE